MQLQETNYRVLESFNLGWGMQNSVARYACEGTSTKWIFRTKNITKVLYDAMIVHTKKQVHLHKILN